jgi:protoporphyrinogen oxidase/GT2 family glycosyltransferase
VLEGASQVGGLARTVRYKDYRFDIGGHRFFTKIPEVQAFWDEVLGDELLDVPRLSRIHYRGKYFHYPLKAMDALVGLGAWQAIRILWSYLRARLWPHPAEENFEQWVTNRFGRRLYEIFFKTYTEKVWGVPCTEIRAEWAAQRIQGLSLASAILTATSLQKRSAAVRSLINQFKYPRLGPGQMWEYCAARLNTARGELRLDHEITALELEGGRVVSAKVATREGEQSFQADHYITTMPLRSLVRALGPGVPPAVKTAADGLAYRDFILVALILDQPELFPDNWIYVHTPGVSVGRIQNFGNWSPALVPDTGKSCLGMEYFCFEGDELWTMQDQELIARASRELEILGLAHGAVVMDGTVVRMPKAYPIYDAGYRANVEIIREYLDAIPNLQTIGRNGMHKYNNQDHSMYTAMLAVENIEGAAHDLWAINTDFEYQEEQRVSNGLRPSGTPAVPPRGARAGVPDLSVIVPVHNGAGFLRTTLTALRGSSLEPDRWELIVVDDSSSDGSAKTSAWAADRVVCLTGGPRGPAFARNRGAEVARGRILAFVDADVSIHPDALQRFINVFDQHPDVSAVFGAYDLAPAAPGLVSQYRNLVHRYVHEREAGPASTFWAGCGAVGAAVFSGSGGFDESRGREALEDIELGYRLSAGGHRILLDPEIQGRHLKRWSLRSMIITDVWRRGIPWVRLLLNQKQTPTATLNIRRSEQACTLLVASAVVAVLGWLWTGAGSWLAVAALCLSTTLVANGPLFVWFARQRGWSFSIRIMPLRLLYYALNGISVGLGLLSLSRKRARVPAGKLIDPLAEAAGVLQRSHVSSAPGANGTAAGGEGPEPRPYSLPIQIRDQDAVPAAAWASGFVNGTHQPVQGP